MKLIVKEENLPNEKAHSPCIIYPILVKKLNHINIIIRNEGKYDKNVGVMPLPLKKISKVSTRALHLRSLVTVKFIEELSIFI